MVHVSFDRNYGKTFKKPRLLYEKEWLDAELKLVGEYGLHCKRELWRVQYALSRIRNNARMLLTLDEKNHCNLRGELPGTLLQTLVFKSDMAKSIHHAIVLIRQRHIRSYCKEIDCQQVTKTSYSALGKARFSQRGSALSQSLYKCRDTWKALLL
ncbi:hypothetical protein MLD38_026167 [Melastoma candidum]|uniref:Uncharacterized protein n=1 Tax=Melastoma candidum TaxID=119954 RepID=A0ACB9NXQ6_9MYRT|nr:hypothetical protein MLD38_026167 [Melastoma candidum]